MGVADEHQLGVGAVEIRLRLFFGLVVVESRRVGEISVRGDRSFDGARGVRARFEPQQFFGIERGAVAFDRVRRKPDEIVRAGAPGHGVVVVAGERFDRDAVDSAQGRARLRTVADDVAEAHDRLHSLRLRVLQDRVERDDVGVQIGYYRITHGTIISNSPPYGRAEICYNSEL